MSQLYAGFDSCYCPACRLHNQPGQVMDAFEVFCRLENISKREAVQRLQASEARPVVDSVRSQLASASAVPSRLVAPPITDRRPLTPDHLAQRRLVDLSIDRRAQPLDRRLFAYVIAHDAQGQGIANATIAAALGAQPDSIKRAKRRLRELGYIDVRSVSTVSVPPRSPSLVRIVKRLVLKISKKVPKGVSKKPPLPCI